MSAAQRAGAAHRLAQDLPLDAASTDPERVFVGLGANLGDTHAALELAVRALAAMPDTRLVALSPLYRSAPVLAEGPDFLNAVAELQCRLEPGPLLQALLRIEETEGRLRPHPNAPRTLDLDLLLYGQRVADGPELTLPHPRLHLRAFVLEPLLLLAPGLEHPRLGPLQPWRDRARDQALWRLDGTEGSAGDFTPAG